MHGIITIDVKPYLIDAETPVFSVLAAIEKGAKRIVFVVDGDNKLLGALADSDVRRHILSGGDLTERAVVVCNKSPISVKGYRRDVAYNLLKQNIYLDGIPIVNDENVVIDIVFRDETVLLNGRHNNKLKDIPVIIMAGGKGTRLYPYTQVLPKPLIPIGDLTITEHIMNEFVKYGCNDFTMIVNHKKNLIRAYFADCGTKYNVCFVDENIPLGTGGGLGLIKNKINSDFFITNCDIMVFEDYSRIYEHHKESGNILTMLCVTKNTEFPYGTVEVNESGRIKALTEKPTFSFLTNAGFYVAGPGFLKHVPENEFIHITDIIQRCIDNEERVGIYPISEEKWSDMGQPEEMEKMRERLGR